jgi:formate hydrogenlyase transcriptional activator
MPGHDVMDVPVGVAGKTNGVCALSEGTQTGGSRAADAVALDQPDGFKTFLAELALGVLDAPPEGTDEALRETLEQLARALGVDRCGFARFTDDGRSLLWSHGFSMPGIPAWPAIDFAALLPWFTGRIREGRAVLLPNLPGDLPAEASAEAEFVAAAGLRSHHAFPLTARGKVLGFLGLGNFRAARRFTPGLVSALDLFAGALAHAFERRRYEARLDEALTLGRSVLASSSSPLLVLDPRGCVVQIGKAWEAAARPEECPDAGAEPGADYLAAWKRASETGLVAAAELVEGVRAVLRGDRDRFDADFSCAPAPAECRHRVTVTPIVGGRGGAVIAQAEPAGAEPSRAELEASRRELRDLRERLDAESSYRHTEAERGRGFEEIVGTSAGLSNVLFQVERVAAADAPVLILGETGTGKDLVARAIHERSRRKDRPLVAVNCAALPDALIESELFGYEKGAFTGAVSRTLGRFEVADGGTILLDEVGELPPAVQAKLLRVLEGGTFERLGSARTIRVDVRLIAATNRDLEKEVREGRFRADLYYRLNVFPLTVPPLRERAEDVPLLVWHFINLKQRALGRTIERVPDRVMRGLEGYAWPGNVRELENMVERALILSNGPTLSVDAAFLHGPGAGAAGFGASLAEVQRAHIEATLRQCGWKVAGKGNAAERLGLKRGTLQFRMKKLGIAKPVDAV